MISYSALPSAHHRWHRLHQVLIKALGWGRESTSCDLSNICRTNEPVRPPRPINSNINLYLVNEPTFKVASSRWMLSALSEWREWPEVRHLRHSASICQRRLVPPHPRFRLILILTNNFRSLKQSNLLVLRDDDIFIGMETTKRLIGLVQSSPQNGLEAGTSSDAF